MHRSLVLLAALAILPAAAGAQQSSAAAWDGFLGCWVNTESSDAGLQVCYLPVAGAPEATERVVLRGDSVVSRGQLRVSEARQPIVADGCEGFEIMRPSADGARIYTEGEVRCGAVRQTTSALLALSTQGELVRVLAVRVGEQKTLVTERYSPVPLSVVPATVRPTLEASQLRARGARVAMLRLLDVDQIETMLQETDPVVVEAWMVEATRDVPGFRAPRRALERLVAAGATPGVIDMAVMLGNPGYFDVHAATNEAPLRPAFRDGFGGGLGGAGRGCEFEQAMMPTASMAYWAAWGYPAFVNPWLFSNHCLPYLFHNPFGLGAIAWSGWSPWSWFYGDRILGGFGPWWRAPQVRGGGFFVPVTGGSLARSIPLGSVEKGRGYSRSSTSTGGGGAVPRGTAQPVREPSNANVHSGGSASGGSSSGGGRTATENSSGTGRTAQPRKPN